MLDILKGNKYRKGIFRKCLILIASSSIIFGCSTLKTVNDSDLTTLPSKSGSVKPDKVVRISEVSSTAETVLIEANIKNSIVFEKRAKIKTIDDSIRVHEAQVEIFNESISAREAQIQRFVDQTKTNKVNHSEKVSVVASVDGSDVTTVPLESDSVTSKIIVSTFESSKSNNAAETVLLGASIEGSVVLDKRTKILSLEKSIKAREDQIQNFNESIRIRVAQIQTLEATYMALVNKVQTIESLPITSLSEEVPAMSSIEQVNRLTAENPTASGMLLPISTTDKNH